jgi:5'-nucleotidase
MNVNFPALPPEDIKTVEVTRQGARDVMVRYFEKRTDLRGRPYYWMGYRNQASTHHDGTDLAAVFSGRISVTPLHIDLTHMPTVHDLKSVLGGAPPKGVPARGSLR